MSLLCSVDAALTIMGSTQSGNTLTAADRLKLQGNLRVATKRVNERFRAIHPPFLPAFEPWKATRKYPVEADHIQSGNNTFHLDDWLLALSGTIGVAGTNITAVETYPDSNYPPFKLLRMTDWSQSWYDFCDSTGAPLQLSVPGTWGFNRDYANAWLAVDALAAGINASVTSLTVADVDGDDPNGIPVRISPGHLLKIDDEYLEVASTNTGTNTVTVKRGVNGTTAADHLIAAAVYRWQVEEDIQRAVARQSGLMFSRFGAYTTVEVQGMSEVRFPNDWLHEALAIMDAYNYG